MYIDIYLLLNDNKLANLMIQIYFLHHVSGTLNHISDLIDVLVMHYGVSDR